MNAQGYAAPRSLEEAVALLSKNPGARVLAGGHSLLVEPNRRAIAGSLLVDIGRIAGLTGIEAQKDGSLRIGAMTTLATIASDAPLARACPALAEAARATADAQLRNRATIAGTLIAVDSDGPLPAVTLVLAATLDVQGQKGTRAIPVEEAPPQGSLAAGDVVTAVRIPAPGPRSGVAYAEVKHPATLGAVCCVAASVTLGADGAVAACRVAVSGATAGPERLAGVEQALTGRKPDEATLAAAAEGAGAGLTFRDDLFGSRDYRAHLTRVLTTRAVNRALAGARQ